ncbi:MAG TPA: serine/threonine-protein kinase, partial [Candidatus Atribacteria bacterium]|nr:serine/threonine-protein kinase [Candidatus Atribacteria bacterium]
ESLRIAKQVCKALSQLHKCKIFHRDIKPENIFICKNQIVKLSDLGISKRMDSAEKASTVAGTWPYMAREVLRGKGDLQSDIHSLGVILYEMVTGKLPFGDAYQEVIKNLNNPRFKVDSPKEYIREYNKDIDDVVIEEINNIILKAIDSDLTRRHKTIDELYQEIDNILEKLEKPKEDFELCIKEAKKLRNIGQTAKAERKYKEVLKNFPNNPRSYYYLSEFYNYVRIPYKAKNILSEGIKRFPGSSLLHYNLALTLREIEDPKALKELEKAIEIGLPEKVEKTAKLLLMAWKSRR